jgi:hypothetical protein
VSEQATHNPNWSPDLVIRAIRRSLGLVALSYTPYFAELFDDRLIQRVRHPSEMDFEPSGVTRPWPIEAVGKRYFVPGSVQDLVDYTSCVIACCPQIEDAWKRIGADTDVGPPMQAELAMGRIGEKPWKQYWNEFHRRSRDIADSGYSWVLNADIEACAARIDGEALALTLSDWKADPDAIRIFGAMQQAWHRFGFTGLPVIGTFSLLNRVYLLDVEQCLRRKDIIFVRNLDDFRLFCRSETERVSAQTAIRDCLAKRGLKLNERKSHFEPFGAPRSSSRRWWLIIKGKGRYGLFRPFLVRLTRHRALRPFCLLMLRAMVRRSG